MDNAGEADHSSLTPNHSRHRTEHAADLGENPIANDYYEAFFAAKEKAD